MKKHIKLIVFIVSLLIVYYTYAIFLNQNKKIIYVPLGDSIAEGMTPENVIDYGYTDYVADFLKSENKLFFYSKEFTHSGYTIDNVKRDINDNKTVEINNKKYHLKEILRESDLVTITIGANDLIKGTSISDISTKLYSVKNVKKEIDVVAARFQELLLLVKQYAKNDIIVTGYFNPLPNLVEYKEKIDEVVKYYNYLIEEICNDLDVTYVDIFDVLEKNSKVFSNSYNIHPNKDGYKLIANEIIKNIE